MSPSGAVDVIVIGGGIVGVSSAAHLAAAGAHVVLLERDALASGASGRNSGVVQHPFDPVLADLHLESLALYRALAAMEEGFALPETPAGLLLVGHDEASVRREAAALTRSHPSLEPAFLDSGAVRGLEPSLASGVSAVRLAIGYPVAPAAATLAYAGLAASNGVAIRTGVAGTPSIARGRADGVVLGDGSRLAADAVLVATGPWTPSVVDPTGRWSPIRSTWGVVVSVALGAAPRHVLEEIEIEIEPGADPGGDDGDDGPADASVAFSLVPAVGGSALGSTFLTDRPDPAAVVPSLLARGRAFIPALETAVVGTHRVCARPQSIDGRPLIGAVPGIEGLWVAAGHGPWGISIGPASGRLVADLIAGRQAAPPLAVDPARFEAPPLHR